MSNVVNLPLAATSYYTVNKTGPFYSVFLVTPCPDKNLKTNCCSFSDRDMAIAQGKRIAARMQRPFKLRGVTV